VEKIVKRPVPVSYILRQTKVNEQFIKHSKELTAQSISSPGNVSTELNYDVKDTDWQLYCPFSSPKLAENYSDLYSRNQVRKTFPVYIVNLGLINHS
jgi:hypothetical protein